jgi:mRNA-degrading endonuclease RelE of RelBE toxin-antitoxin system
MRYLIVVHELAAEEIEDLRKYDQGRIVAAIEKQLRHEPGVASRRRKCLTALTPSFEHVSPVWELRIGEFRVFYDVDNVGKVVHVRAVRRKEPRQRTEDIV